MSFVEVDRFYDLPSGHVATSALRAAGIPAILSGEHTASVIPVWMGLQGGLRLLVPEEDAAASREILDQAVPPDPEALNWGHHPQAQSGIPIAMATLLASMLAWPMGLAMVAHRQRQTWLARIGLAMLWAAILYLLVTWLWQVWGPSERYY
jgi:hypothetical protein